MAEMITVFRASDGDSEQEAARLVEALQAQGIQATLVTDEEPGVVVGTQEVRVPAEQAARAEQIVAAEMLTASEGNTSHDFDLVDVFSAETADAEMEALAIRSLLESNDIPCVMVGTSQIPSLPFAVQVPKVRSEEALRIIAEAREAGPEAAEEAEAQTEGQS